MLQMKLVLANPDAQSLKKIEFELKQKGYDVIGTATDGMEVIDMVNTKKPDILVTHLVMPNVDAIGILDILKSDNSDIPVIVMAPAAVKDFIVAEVFEHGADYFIIGSVYDKYIANQIDAAVKIFNNRSESSSRKVTMVLRSSDEVAMEKEITDLLIRMGLKVDIKGFGLIRKGILIALEDMSILDSITKKFYPRLAYETNDTPSRVERAIRHSIEVLFSNRSNNTELLDELFGFTINSNTGKPTNSEFMFLIADKIRLDNKVWEVRK